MLRIIGGIIAGIVAGFAAMLVVAMIGGLIFPSNAVVDPFKSDQLLSAADRLSLGAQLTLVASWFVSALAGAAVAKAIAGRSWAAWTVGGLFVLYVLLTVLILRMPGWLQAASIIAPIIGTFLGNHLVKERPARPGAAPGADA